MSGPSQPVDGAGAVMKRLILLLACVGVEVALHVVAPGRHLLSHQPAIDSESSRPLSLLQ
jgi:hypothetical protein